MPLNGEALRPPLDKPRPRVLDRRDGERDAEREKRRVYAEIDARDQKVCRCCGRRGNPYATTALGKLHRAHIRDASRGGLMAAWNLVSLCWICHALEHAKQLFIIGTNANKVLRFEIKEVAFVEVFAARELPKHVRIIV